MNKGLTKFFSVSKSSLVLFVLFAIKNHEFFINFNYIEIFKFKFLVKTFSNNLNEFIVLSKQIVEIIYQSFIL